MSKNEIEDPQNSEDAESESDELAFPKRCIQHQHQTESFAILLYALRKIGIFINYTENDYGIDFEIEIIENDVVAGHYIKAQVKSSASVSVKANNRCSIGGLKQSTLHYWTELSYRSPVVAFLIDLDDEQIYCSEAVFWQATILLDGTKKSKTLELLPKMNSLEKHLRNVATQPDLPSQLYAHSTLLRNLKEIYRFYAEAFHYDPSHCVDVYLARVILECTWILHQSRPCLNQIAADIDPNHFSFEYWEKQGGGQGTGEIYLSYFSEPLKILMKQLLLYLDDMRDVVIKGSYYWQRKNPQYFDLVTKTKIAKYTNHKELVDWIDRNDLISVDP